MKILNCTLHDGGYYTSWDFDGKSNKVVESVIGLKLAENGYIVD